ncbi:MAG TPA: DUF4145 domain-containing protein [Deltaproteobacteria bacterium]|nr:DUF4145 domain-containing protein [Deltaproteobacteria bacterium]
MTGAAFHQGHWMPTLPGAGSSSFGFLERGDPLRELAQSAEGYLHVDPNTCLYRLRQFAEQLTRALHGPIPQWEHPNFHDLLRELQERGVVDRDNLARLHELRQAGNRAAHELGGSPREALSQLRKAHALALWYASDVLGHTIEDRRFRKPPDPRKLWQDKLQQLSHLEEQHNTAQQDLERLKAEAESAQARAEHEASRRTEAEEQARIWQDLAEDQASVAARLEEASRTAARIQRIRSELTAEGLLDQDEPGLPDWVAALAADPGGVCPYPVGEELLDEIIQLGREVELPPIQAPRIRLESSGNLASSSSGGFQLGVALSAEGELHREGAVWSAPDGESYLIPATLRAALDTAEQGAPEAQPGEPPAQATRRRKLWWGRLRRQLAAHDVELDPYLSATDAVVVEKLRPYLDSTDDGGVDLRVTAAEVEEDLTDALEKLGGRVVRDDPQLRWRDEDGTPRRRTVVLSDVAREGAKKILNLRWQRAKSEPYLIDAPESVLDPELFDLSEYSDRVVGFAPVVFRVNRSAISAQSEEGLLSGKQDGELLELALTPEEEATLAGLLQAASRGNRQYIRFKEQWIRVPSEATARELAGATERRAERKTLVIQENLEEAAFMPDDAGEGLLVEIGERPPCLAQAFDLLPHQHTGWRWLAGHAAVVPGASDHGMLADDMGLGKTLQVLSLMSTLQDRDKLSPCLLVAPASLLQNWEREADRFFPGRFTDRARLVGRQGKPTGHVWVMCSYETLRNRQLELGRIRWRLMVCDESHRIRNPTAQLTHAVMAMDTERRIALSGTPLQNSLEDLWTQFDWLSPGFLGDLKSFRETYNSRRREAPGTRQATLAGLREQIEPRILRRRKEDEVADSLPPKHIHRIRLEATPLQAELYDRILQEHRETGGSALGTVQRLLQVTAHPRALSDEPSLVLHPKMQWLLELLAEIESKGEKAIVFAEWYALQDDLVHQVEARFGKAVERINGRVEAGLRLAKIERFNEALGFEVMVLGPKAAGVGLNITGANHVVHFTRHWNPAHEAQATDRAYRIGQTRPVHVYLPIVHHRRTQTVEQHLDRLLERKVALMHDVLMPTEDLKLTRDLEQVLQEPDV